MPVCYFTPTVGQFLSAGKYAPLYHMFNGSASCVCEARTGSERDVDMKQVRRGSHAACAWAYTLGSVSIRLSVRYDSDFLLVFYSGRMLRRV